MSEASSIPSLAVLCAATTTCAVIAHWRVRRFLIASLTSALIGSLISLVFEMLRFWHFPPNLLASHFLRTSLITIPISLIVGFLFVLHRRRLPESRSPPK